MTTDGSHPFSTHPTCASCTTAASPTTSRPRDLEAVGEEFVSDNDTEVAARLIGHEMATGVHPAATRSTSCRSSSTASTPCCARPGTSSPSSAIRLSCKPAIVAVHDRYVAMASEYRALADLPDIDKAKIFEPIAEPTSRLESALTTIAPPCSTATSIDARDQHELRDRTRIRRAIVNPKGRHNMAVGLMNRLDIRSTGDCRPLHRRPV